MILIKLTLVDELEITMISTKTAWRTSSITNDTSNEIAGSGYRQQEKRLCQVIDHEQEGLGTIKELPENGDIFERRFSRHGDSYSPAAVNAIIDSRSGAETSPSKFIGCQIPGLSSNSSPTTDPDEALSADEGIQTSPPFEVDDPWDQLTGVLDELNPVRRRRHSMSALIQQTLRCHGESSTAGGTGDSLRSPVNPCISDEMKTKRSSRYRPKSCSLPHAEWLIQRTETALDRSAEMQKRTAQLLRSAKFVRDQEI